MFKKCLELKTKINEKSTYFPSNVVSPVEMFEYLMEILMKMARTLGAQFFDDDFTPCNKIFMILMCTFLLTINIQIWNFYNLIDTDLSRATICIMGITGAFQAFAKTYIFAAKYKQVNKMKYLSLNFYKQLHTVYAFSVYELRLMQTTKILVFLVILYIFCFVFMGFYPILFKFLLNIDATFLELVIPFLDWKNSWLAYFIHLVYWFYADYCFMISLILANFVMIIFLVSAMIQYDILKELLTELSEVIVMKDDKEKKDKIKNLMKLIIDVHVNLLEFLDIFVDVFRFYFFVEIAALVLQMIISLFALSTFDFLPGYMLIVAATFQIFMPCLLSTLIIVKAEKFTENINNVPWYLLSIKDQKVLMMIMKASQEKKTLSTGIIELNISTFVEMYKVIYSYWMMLKELN